MNNGKVYLIGAGPGDVELLTLKAVRCLQICDVVLIDDLANPEVLRFASPNAEVIKVGKRGGRKKTPQELIYRTMIKFARQGKLVARLKGGDPFIFGRGGEELQALQAADVPVEIVNGITSGIAAPSVLGIPLTHRDVAHSVTFITGHCLQHNQPNLKSLIHSGATIVIYMGALNLPNIASCFINEGCAPGTPVAVIQSATLPDQQVVVTTLSRLVPDVEAAHIVSPAIIIVGDVVNLCDPEKILVTSRPSEYARSDMEELLQPGHPVTSSITLMETEHRSAEEKKEHMRMDTKQQRSETRRGAVSNAASIRAEAERKRSRSAPLDSEEARVLQPTERLYKDTTL